jgi:hypothetical protein
MVCTSHLCHLKHTLPPTQAWRAIIDLFSYTHPLPRPQGAGEGSDHLSRGGAAVLMPKQARGHQGAPREYPEKNGPRGLRGTRQYCGTTTSGARLLAAEWPCVPSPSRTPELLWIFENTWPFFLCLFNKCVRTSSPLSGG